MPDCDVRVKNEMETIFSSLFKEYNDASLRLRLKEVFKIDDKIMESLNLNTLQQQQQQGSKSIEVVKKEPEVKQTIVQPMTILGVQSLAPAVKEAAKPIEEPVEVPPADDTDNAQDVAPEPKEMININDQKQPDDGKM